MDKKRCFVKTTLRDNRDNAVSILIQDMYLDLDQSVEDQVHDYFPMHTVLDFKWSEDMNAFKNTRLPTKDNEIAMKISIDIEDDECPVLEGRRLRRERYFYI